jgi:hypothetical protein
MATTLVRSRGVNAQSALVALLVALVLALVLALVVALVVALEVALMLEGDAVARSVVRTSLISSPGEHPMLIATSSQ